MGTLHDMGITIQAPWRTAEVCDIADFNDAGFTCICACVTACVCMCSPRFAATSIDLEGGSLFAHAFVCLGVRFRFLRAEYVKILSSMEEDNNEKMHTASPSVL